MAESYVNKLKYHKILLFVLSIIYSILGTLILARLDFVSEDLVVNICWFFMLLLLLIIIACFDKYSQPYLYVYHKSLIVIPWIYFIGFIGAIAILNFANYIVLSIVFLFLCLVGALAFYCCLFHGKRKMNEEEIRRIIGGRLITIDSENLEFLQKRRAFYKWNSLISIAIIIIIGKIVIQYNWIYLAVLLLIFGYNIICYYKIYSIKYTSLKSTIGHLAMDGFISIAFLTLSVLLNFGIIPFEATNISDLDITMLSCFGLIPFAKQSSFAYFAVEHNRLREELENDYAY